MSDNHTFLDRNRAFAATYTNDLTLMPRFSTIILSCIDARVDPAHIMGIGAGDALVMRNVGARVSDDVAFELGLLWRMVATIQGEGFKGISLAILHHTDCGASKLAAPGMQTKLSQSLGVDEARLDPVILRGLPAGLYADIERLKASPYVPDALKVSGLLYDVASGLVEEVIPEQPLGKL